MARKIYNAGKLEVRLDEALSKGQPVRTAELEDLAEEDGRLVEVNRNLSSKVELTYYPSIRQLMDNAYVILDSEFRRFERISRQSGLDNSQFRNLGIATRSLCQLASLDSGMREDNSLEAKSDEEIVELANVAFKRLNKEPDDGSE